jgi:hypothetical protein
MESFFSSIIKSMNNLSPIPVIPSAEFSDRTTPASQIDHEITHQTIRIPHNNIDSLISDMTKEIKISEMIIQKDETQITEPKQLTKLQKYKTTLNKLIQSLQNKIQAISTHSINITDEIIDFLNESLKNIRTINNICNKIYANKSVHTTS